MSDANRYGFAPPLVSRALALFPAGMVVPMIILMVLAMIVAMVIAVLVVFAMRVRRPTALPARGVTATAPTTAASGCMI